MWPSLLHLLQISVYGKSRNRSSGRQPIGPSSRRPLIFHKYSRILTLMIQHHRPKRWHRHPDHTCLGCIFIFLRSISITVRQHDPLQHRILQSADSLFQTSISTSRSSFRLFRITIILSSWENLPKQSP